MFSEYTRAAFKKRAKYETLKSGSYMVTVEGLPGVIAAGKSIGECREDLIRVIEEWVNHTVTERPRCTCPGRPYNWGLAGADGCCLELFPFPIESS
jgi:predicted RNase H-like HicB family nuclease